MTDQFLRIDAEVTKAGAVERQETRYLITSLESDQVSPERLMDLVRGHWSVENGLHFIKDRWWDDNFTQTTTTWVPMRVPADDTGFVAYFLRGG